MLSWKKGTPIAKVRGGKYDKRILRLYDPDKHGGKISGVGIGLIEDPIEFLISKGVLGNHKYKRLNYTDITKIAKALNKDIEPFDEDLAEIFNVAKTELKKASNKELVLHSGELIPLPNEESREICYVSGASGAGKSTWCAKYAAQYKRMYPDRDIYIFSRKEEDEVLDVLGPKRIIIDNELVETPIDASELEECLVIFDDCDSIPDKEQHDAIRALQNEILEIGRAGETNCIITSHQICNFKKTRDILNEAQNVVFYPKSSGTYAIKYFLKQYGGLDKKAIEKAISLPSRWVMLSKRAPMMIIYDKGAYLVHD